jgi:hypothetical protein
MPVAEFKFIVFALIAFDILIVAAIVFLIKRVKTPSPAPSFDKALSMIENLIKEADETERRFGLQMKEKRRLITQLNQQLDKRIISLNILFNRADLLATASPGGTGSSSTSASATDTVDKQQAQIVSLARKGHKAAEIAQKLSIPKGEVQLVLNLKRQLTETGGSGSS